MRRRHGSLDDLFHGTGTGGIFLTWRWRGLRLGVRSYKIGDGATIVLDRRDGPGFPRERRCSIQDIGISTFPWRGEGRGRFGRRKEPFFPVGRDDPLKDPDGTFEFRYRLGKTDEGKEQKKACAS